MIKYESKELTIGNSRIAGSLISVIKGTLAAYIFLVVSFGILAVVYTYTSMPDSVTDPAINVLTIVSLVLGGAFSSKTAWGFGWLHGALTGLMYTVIRIIIGYAVFKNYVPDSGMLSLFAVGMLSAAIGGIIGINFKKR